MSAPKFTPGPWKPCRSHEDFEGPLFDIDEEDAASYAARPFVSIEAEFQTIALAHDLFEFDEANARLIAAAPDLYAALEGLLRVCSLHFEASGFPSAFHANAGTVDVARAALAKARGEA